MIKSNEISVAKVPATAPVDATKDAGRVQIGGAGIHFGDVTPVRDAVKDTGRVRIGGAGIQF